MSKESITVGIRIRPMLPQQQHNQEDCTKVEGNKIILTNNHKLKTFQFGYILDKTATQQEVYQIFGLPLIEDFTNGYSCCLLCYGQNDSGKSYSIAGKDSEESKGLLMRMMDHLSDKIIVNSMNKVTYLIGVSYVEMNEEQVIDLLSIKKNQIIEIVEGKNKEIQMKNVEIKYVNKIEEIESFYLLGNRKKDLAYSKKYRYPQNGTSIFTLYLESMQQTQSGSLYKKSQFHIVDLEASDKMNRFEAVLLIADRKAPKYNLSQSGIKNIINGIVYGSEKTKIAYNDSKVTKLLRNCFGGHIKTRILFHLNPISKFYEASLNTLRIATAAAMIENTPNSYVEQSQMIIPKKLQELQFKREKFMELDKQFKNLVKYQQEDHEKDSLPEEMQELVGQNQFISEEMRIKIKQILLKKVNEVNKRRQQAKKAVSNISSMFLDVEPFKKTQRIVSLQQKYEKTVQKMAKTFQKYKTKQVWQSSQNYFFSQVGEANFVLRKMKDRERLYRQQISDLHRQFQKQRQLMTNTIRQLQQKSRFYEKISQTAIRKQQIQILKLSSKYDETKRSYQIPLFAIKDKKISHGSRYYSPKQNIFSRSLSNKSISERRFLMTQLSGSKLQQLRSPKIQAEKKGNLAGMKQIISHSEYSPPLVDSYFHRRMAKVKPKEDDQKKFIPYINRDEYQFKQVEYNHNYMRRKSKGVVDENVKKGRSTEVKVISPRFKFK